MLFALLTVGVIMTGPLLNIALLVGVATVLLNLTDLLLRESQRRNVRNALDTLTLFLAYQRPLTWLTRLPKGIIVIPFLACASFVAFALSVDRPLPRAAALLFLPAYIGMTLYAPPIVFARYSTSIFRRLGGDARITALARNAWTLTKDSFFAGLRLYPLALGLALLLSIAIAIVDAIAEVSSGHSIAREDSRMMQLLGSVIVVDWVMLKRRAETFLLARLGIPVLATIVMLSLVFGLLELLLKLGRAMCWRIVEYQKGPVAAVVLIVTSVLALLKLFTSVK